MQKEIIRSERLSLSHCRGRFDLFALKTTATTVVMNRQELTDFVKTCCVYLLQLEEKEIRNHAEKIRL